MKENNELPHIKADDSLGMRVIQSGSGYSVEITYGGQAVAHHNSGGEFDLFIENDDRQYNLSFNSLSLPEYRVEGNKIILSGKFPMETFISYLWVRVEYELLHKGLIRKRIFLSQRNQPVLYYILRNSLEPIEKPKNWWSFDSDQCSGGSIQERYPAAGFHFDNGLCMGLLTDAGYRNHWTFNRRKRKVAPDFGYDAFEMVKTLPDPNFLTVANERERAGGNGYVAYTFGEVHDYVSCKNGGYSRQAYNPMFQGEEAVKTLFIFAEPDARQNIRDYRMLSQLRLAEGLGFKGNDVEKIIYADVMMNIWVTSPRDLTPHVVPNLNYSPDMYNRDSFFTISALHDKELNECIWNKWAATQEDNGCIGTIITPYTGSVESKGNEATLHFIIWALMNRIRFGSDIPIWRIEKALKFCRQEFDPDGDAYVKAHFSLSQMDIQTWFAPEYPDGIGLAVNQGLYAVALRAAKDLGCDVEEEYLKKAETAYRNYYNANEKYLMQYREDPSVVAIYDLGPEFLSVLIWGRPILGAEIVCNTLDRYPVFGDCAPIQGRRDGTWYTPDNHPFAEEMLNPPGMYYNNGSWLREEYCSYALGLLYGWEPAKERMERRLRAEIDLNPDEPYSHEFLCTNKDTPLSDWWFSTGVFCWNIFILLANEMVELRKPEDDPSWKPVYKTPGRNGLE